MLETIFGSLPPAWFMIFGGLLALFLKEKEQRICLLVLPVLTAIGIFTTSISAAYFEWHVTGFALDILHIHDYTYIFASAFALAAFLGMLFGFEHAKSSELIAATIYAGSAIGVTYSGDFISLFIYWEVMAIASTILVLNGGSKESNASAIRYMAMHALGGVILMAGIIEHIYLTGQTSVSVLGAVNFESAGVYSFAKWMILIGVLINAAAPPFSAWLPDSYPNASAFGTVFLSAFTTKTAVFVLLLLFPGTEILIYIGIFMVFYGIVMAILENDMRRILAYSIINQVGFMVTAIGIGTPLAQNGAAAHAFTHIIYKALLLMSAGSVLHMTGKSKCSELGGLYRTMPITMICGCIGALAISAFPLTSGFVSKSLISQAAAFEQLEWVWFALIAASAGVFLHAGIKFPWFVFFQKDSGMRPKDPSMSMRLAMIFAALLCVLPAIPGWAQGSLYALLPNVIEYEAYSYTHVVTQLQLLLFAGAAFFVMLPMLKRTDTITLDFDWGYRRACRVFVQAVQVVYEELKGVWVPIGAAILKASDIQLERMHRPNGIIMRHRSIGMTALWVLILLGAYLLLFV